MGFWSSRRASPSHFQAFLKILTYENLDGFFFFLPMKNSTRHRNSWDKMATCLENGHQHENQVGRHRRSISAEWMREWAKAWILQLVQNHSDTTFPTEKMEKGKSSYNYILPCERFLVCCDTIMGVSKRSKTVKTKINRKGQRRWRGWEKPFSVALAGSHSRPPPNECLCRL